MKVLSIMLIVMLLVAFAAPVFADEGGEPNDNACWGQLHKAVDVKVQVKIAKDAAADAEMNFGQYCKEVLKPLHCGE